MMKSKERVLTALARQQPDRVPVNYLANPGIDRRLKDHYGLTADDTEGLRKILGVDFREVESPYVGPALHENIPGRRIDMFGIRRRWVEHESGGYWDYCDFPLRYADEEIIDGWRMPSPDNFDYDLLLNSCGKFREYGVFYGNPGLGDIINSAGMIRTMEQVLVDLVTDDPAGLKLIDRRLDVQLEVMSRSLEKAKGLIDFVWLGEDLGTQRGPTIGLGLYRKHIRPRHQKFVDLAKSYGLPVIIHSCGSSSWAFEDFIEMGIDAVDTLQPEAKDMSPDYLKKRFGGRLAFHGCISTAGPVAYGTVTETVEYAKKTLEIMMPGGGYCIAPTHDLQDNSPTENVLALYETAKAFGVY
ncbi:MAG: uroporphyrinogen decarboxylase family protein [bacterium]